MNSSSGSPTVSKSVLFCLFLRSEGTSLNSPVWPMRWPTLRMNLILSPTTRWMLTCYHNQRIASPSRIYFTLLTQSRPLCPGLLSTFAPVYLVRHIQSPEKTGLKCLNDLPCYWYIVWWSLFTVLFFPPGVLVCVFSVVAVHGGLAVWSLSVLTIIMLVCLIITFIVWRQPQSKTKLAFKVSKTFLILIVTCTIWHFQNISMVCKSLCKPQ